MSLRKWNPKGVPYPFASLCIASRRSGKSYLIRYLYLKYWSKKFDAVLVMCPTDHEDFYPSFVSGNMFYREYDPDVLEALLASQQAKKDSGEKAPSVLVILDDCSDEREKYAGAIQKVYTSGRHYNISIVYCVQGTTLTGPHWRNNADFVLIGRANGGLERKNLVDNFLVGLADDDELGDRSEKSLMMELLKKYTVDHNFLVINNTSKDYTLCSQLQTFRASDDVNIKLTVEKTKRRDIQDVLSNANALLR